MAVPVLGSVRKGLRSYVESHPDSADAWLMLSQACEALVDYKPALTALRRAMLAGRRGKKELKSLARLLEGSQFWSSVDLSPEQAGELGAFLGARIQTAARLRDFSLTLEWLSKVGHQRPCKVLDGAREYGCFDDWQLFMNLLATA